VRVTLPDDPSVTALGRVREASPQADPVTGTYLVKIALDRPPPAMFLGATVVGSVSIGDEPVVRVPGTALLDLGGKPAVWVVDEASSQVMLREVKVLRYDPSAVIVSDGLKDGEIVVAAGVHALRAGQKVRLLDRPAEGKPGSRQ
jgi:RND family efflux transporter MFP subunit